MEEERFDIAKFFMDHKSQDSHHGGTSLVQFDGTLLDLGFFIKGIPSKVNVSVTEITNKFTLASDILHDEQFQKTNESKDLRQTNGRNVGKSGNTVSHIGEFVTGQINVTGQVLASGIGQVAHHGQHTDTSVLQFDKAQTIKLFLVAIGDQTQRIKESHGSNGTNVIFKGTQGSGRGTLLGSRGKGGGRSEERGKNGRFHDDKVY
mmetsp:Transcript_35128/g.73166  ORF Transcript_35128/g.73166 Transcript_35128/m.73166 type:complete len:205 (+) Transcript_35128:216-830(+)